MQDSHVSAQREFPVQQYGAQSFKVDKLTTLQCGHVFTEEVAFATGITMKM